MPPGTFNTVTNTDFSATWLQMWLEYKYYSLSRKMPQVDKATFFPIVFWSFVLYTGGYLVLNLSFMFRFFSSMKMVTRRFVEINKRAVAVQSCTNTMLFFPWISL